MNPARIFCVFFMLLAFTVPAALAKGLYIDPADDENNFGDPADIFSWTPRQQVAGYRNIEKLSPARKVPASTAPLMLPRAEQDLGEVLIVGEHEEEPFSLTVNQYFENQNVAGLLVIQNGAVVYERYGLGNTESSRWTSFSISKSVVSMLFGAAIRDGYILNVDERITEYLPRLRQSSYENTTIKNLLQMASGVEWNEDYSDPESDISTASWETLSIYDFLGKKERVAAPGEVYNYNTAESNLAGNLLRTAIGNNLSTYLHHKIWQPFGMEHDAYWLLTEEGGGEFGGCCLAATLRDYGRIGLFTLADGKLDDGSMVLPEGWMSESTTPSETAGFYGYLWWLRENNAFQAAGIYGQGIHIEPEHDIVIAIQSAWPVASDQRNWALQNALFAAITKAVTGF
ncbi:MAG TPA: serine hydrolase [Xanthomonadales bacterium]|nr:serine hydrolase [Xanthomonadales bacterium]